MRKWKCVYSQSVKMRRKGEEKATYVIFKTSNNPNQIVPTGAEAGLKGRITGGVACYLPFCYLFDWGFHE